MRIRIIAVGRLKAGPERDLCADYLNRFAATGRGIGLNWREAVELDESRARQAAQRKADDAASIRARLEPGDNRLVVLDEGGTMASSIDLADRIGKWRDSSVGETVFAIGGPDGFDSGFSAESHAKIAFGRVTWPHRLVRIMLAEQLYRSATILSGHPYHRG